MIFYLLQCLSNELRNKYYFYILWILKDKVISLCFISIYTNYLEDGCIENCDEYLISSLIVVKDYQKQWFRTNFIESVIRILIEENANKDCAFAHDKSRKLFEILDFLNDEKIKSFGINVPEDVNSVKYRLKLLFVHIE